MNALPRRASKALAALLLWPLSAAAAPAPVPTFEEAFARDEAELLATRAALEAAMAKAEADAAREERRLTRRVAAVEASTLALQERARALTAERDRLDEAVLAVEDHAVALKVLLETAQLRARQRGQPFELAEAPADSLDIAVAAAVRALDEGGRVRISPGRFFDADGQAVDGDRVLVGNVAALGVSEGAGGVLVPSGEHLRLYDGAAPARTHAERLLTCEATDAIDVVLTSPGAAPPQVEEAEGLFGLAERGGAVAWIILALAGLGLLLVVERAFTLLRLGRLGGPSFERVAGRLRAGDYEGAQRLTARMGAVGRAIASVIGLRHLPRGDIEARVSESILQTMPSLERSLTLLVVIAAIAPLLGLLGTVTGMISTFDVITEHGTGDPKLLSGGISVALITTELGLAVAVPFLLLRTVITRWSDRIADAMQTYALATLNLLELQEPRDEP